MATIFGLRSPTNIMSKRREFNLRAS